MKTVVLLKCSECFSTATFLQIYIENILSPWVNYEYSIIEALSGVKGANKCVI